MGPTEAQSKEQLKAFMYSEKTKFCLKSKNNHFPSSKGNFEIDSEF